VKNLHIPTILVTLGLVGLVAILSAQNKVAAPSVQVSNPLGVPGWVPSGVWIARFGLDPTLGSPMYSDYKVPKDHFALIMSSTGAQYNGSYRGSIKLDEGAGFYRLTGELSGAGVFTPGIVVDEGVVIRASQDFSNGATSDDYMFTLHGYVIPK
jgi:hypothetical protein